MPYSSLNAKPELLEIAKRFLPTSVLDIGAGSGAYSDLFKNIKGFNPLSMMTGIEIWDPWVEQFDLKNKYCRLLVTDAKTGVAQLAIEESQFGLIIIGDMLEHLSRTNAVELIEACKTILAPDGALLISLPIGDYPQGAWEGNPFEAHLDTWHEADVYQDIKPNYFFQRGEIGIAMLFLNEELARKRITPKISAYAICKNEEEFIERCIKSLRDADEIVVVDTGSTDQTYNKLKALQSSFPVNVTKASIQPWRFDDARNLALSLTNPECDLCISIDADEILEPDFINNISAVWLDSLLTGNKITRFNHGFKTVWDWRNLGINVSEHFHERVHARFGYRWIHPVHEKLITREQEYIGWCETAIMCQMPDQAKARPYLEPLKLALEEDPHDWKLWAFYAAELEANKKPVLEVYEAFSHALACKDCDHAWVQIQLMLLCERTALHDKAKTAIGNLISIANTREAFMYIGEYYERCSNFKLAKLYFGMALDILTETRGYMRRSDAWNGSLNAKFAALEFK